VVAVFPKQFMLLYFSRFFLGTVARILNNMDNDLWEEYWDSEKKCVYDVHRITGEKRYHTEDDFVDSDEDHQSTQQVSAPDGWEARTDEASGATYYFNLHTGEASWEMPDSRQSTSHINESSPWEERLDEASGVMYYFNTLTGVASWERPAEMDFVGDAAALMDAQVAAAAEAAAAAVVVEDVDTAGNWEVSERSHNMHTANPPTNSNLSA
tara:strand:- start:853 stop:1485 length:633 start_codon:yes stop_codon:yes gene_type:complete